MPLLKASIKHDRQSKVRQLRRASFKTRMKSSIRKVEDLMKDKKADEAVKALSQAFKAIDTASKKHLIHWKNAANKKSRLSRLVSPKK